MNPKIPQGGAEALLSKHWNGELPVPVEELAEALGLRVEAADLGDVSGLLVFDGKRSHIFVHAGHHPHRKRFTVAHELGHFVLGHQFQPGPHVHVDKGHHISRRDARSATGTDRKEIEANQFAANLLMPADTVTEQARRLAEDGVLMDGHVLQLSSLFMVSEQAMTIRLTALDLL